MQPRIEPALYHSYDSVKAAVAAAKKSRPGRIYRVVNLPPEFKDGFSMIIAGCQGHGDDAQKQTAALMGKLDIKLAFWLGDNFYDYGISNPTEPVVNERFFNIVPPNFRNILITGNHDRAEQNFAK